MRALLSVLALLVGIGWVGCERGVDSSLPVSDPLPGASVRSPELMARLREAVASQGSSYRPRTRHRRADGTARYTNRLMLERSPYLRQHAHNPVDWYPWGEEAFARAKSEGKLILLSVGYATCHWCHVMEEESFEDEEIATRLNTDYLAIKVDREERPDVDATYLQAVTLLTGNGGWPMTVWLTPDREVFFAGTYFPPRDGERGGHPGFATLLEQLAASYRTKPASIVAAGRALTARVHALADVEPAAETPGRAVLDAAFQRYQATFDQQHGGFGRAPKFPMPATLEFLLRYHRRTQEPAALLMVQRTLEHLAGGGVRDQLGGGFHRYAIDAAWQIPHFEKMLYDNAQLASVYLWAWQATGEASFADVAREILDDLIRTLRAPGGAFHAAIDADDPGGEGAYYVWTPAEIDLVLEPAPAAAVRAYYGVEEGGNFDGKTILHVARALPEIAAAMGMEVPRFSALVAKGRLELLSARLGRAAPLVDTKILAGWNGLAITAFARAGAILGEPRYVHVAREAAEFILDRMRPAGRLQRVFAEGTAGQAAFLEDYAFVTAGFLDLYEATFDLRWLQEAERLQATLADEFWDGDGGAFFASGADRDAALPRPKPADDGAVPSGNAVAAENLLRLATLTNDDNARRRAAECVRGLGRGLVAMPTSAPRLLGVVEALLDRPREIVIVEPANGGAETSAALVEVVRGHFLPNRALLVTREGAALAAAQRRLPFVGEKRALDDRTTAYVCERGRCLLPTFDPAVLARQLTAVQPLLPIGQKSD